MWSLFAFITIHQLAQEQREYAKLINISGKQRMLSQRSALISSAMEHNSSSYYVLELQKTIDALQANHAYILSHIPSDKIASLYYDEPHSINKKIKAYIEFLELHKTKAKLGDHDDIYLKSSDVLRHLDYAVSVFQSESIVFVNRFDALEKFILGGSLLTIILEAIFLVLPILRRNEAYVSEIERKRRDFDAILSTSKDGIALLDLEAKFTFANSAYLEMVGYTMDELRGQSYAKLCPQNCFFDFLKSIDETIKNGYIENAEKICMTKENKKLILSVSMALMPDLQRLVVSTKNITETKRLERQNLEYIKLVDENIITSSTDLLGTITYVSDAFCKISEFSRDELIGTNHRIARHPDTSKEIFRAMWATIKNDKTWDGEIKNITKSGSFYWVKTMIYPIYDENGKKCGYTAIRQNITDKKLIEEISVTDRLTGLYNRFKLDELFAIEFEKATRYKRIFSIILIDVDHFKSVNDLYGHQAGDRVLTEVAKILRDSVRKSDVIGRWGGEEFLIITPETDANEAMSLANKLRKIVEGHSFEGVGSKTISLGVTSYLTGDKMEDIFKRADEALYIAKNTGRNKSESR